ERDGDRRRVHRARPEDARRRSRAGDDSRRSRGLVQDVPAVPGGVGAERACRSAPPWPAAAGPGTVGTTVAEVFGLDGPLARSVPDFEPRAGQVEMASAVAQTFEQGGVLLAEAGTGTGKTLAYLVPAILTRQRVLISTGTKNLQEQIYFKDIPALRDALGVPFTAACMKGRANYLCLHRLGQLSEDADRAA